MAGTMDTDVGARFERGAPAAGAVVGALVTALSARDPLEREHNRRVVGYSRLLARQVEPALVDVANVDAGYALHDIGKMALPDATLRRRGPLSARDWRLIHRHTLIGEEMI